MSHAALGQQFNRLVPEAVTPADLADTHVGQNAYLGNPYQYTLHGQTDGAFQTLTSGTEPAYAHGFRLAEPKIGAAGPTATVGHVERMDPNVDPSLLGTGVDSYRQKIADRLNSGRHTYVGPPVR